jgi:hypothetical protein
MQRGNTNRDSELQTPIERRLISLTVVVSRIKYQPTDRELFHS